MNHAWSRSPLKLTHAYTYTFLLLWNLMGRSGSYLYGTCLTLKHIQAIEVAFPHAMPRTEEKGRCTATCHQVSIDQMIHQRKIQDPRLQSASVNWVKCFRIAPCQCDSIPWYSILFQSNYSILFLYIPTPFTRLPSLWIFVNIFSIPAT